MEEFDYFLKLIMLGDSGVGKSSILIRFAEDQFFEHQPTTIGVDFKVKYMTIEGIKFKIMVWDTAGQERFRTITSSYYRDAQGVCLIYDVARRETFTNIGKWLSELDHNVNSDNLVKMLVGNKVDLDRRQVQREEAEAFAKKNDLIYVETSAKMNFSVAEAFIELAKVIILNKRLLDKNSVNTRSASVHQLDQRQAPARNKGKCKC